MDSSLDLIDLGARLAARKDELQALQMKTNPVCPTRSAWLESLHSPAHSNPLVSVAAAFALGPVVFFVPG